MSPNYLFSNIPNHKLRSDPASNLLSFLIFLFSKLFSISSQTHERVHRLIEKSVLFRSPSCLLPFIHVDSYHHSRNMQEAKNLLKVLDVILLDITLRFRLKIDYISPEI